MVNRMPDISIVIPFYERFELTILAVASAWMQRNVETEVIVVDDGSTGDSSLVETYVTRGGGIFMRQPHRGIAVARNTGLAAASGRWVTFVDSDDLLYPLKSFRQIEAAMHEERVWSCSGFDLLAERGERIGGDSLSTTRDAFWRSSCPFGSTSVVARRDIVQQIRGFDETFDRSEDWDFFIRLGDLTPPAIVAERLYGYRLHCGNVTGRDPNRWIASWQQISRKHRLNVRFVDYPGIVNNLPSLAPELFNSAAVAARFTPRAAGL